MIKKTVIAQFEDVAKKYPNNVAIITESENVEFGELNRRANQLAYYIKERGLNYHSVIGVCLPPSIEMVVSVLAIQKLGLPYVPLDISYPVERIEYMINDAGISCLLTVKDIIKKVGSVSTDILCLDQVDYCSTRIENLPAVKNDIVYILYTSGSTGNPKGVEVYQHGLVNYLNYSCDKYLDKKADFVNPASFVYLPLAFDASVTSLYSPLMVGRAIVIPSKQGIEVFDDELVQNGKFDFVKLTPAHLLILKERMRPELLKCWTKYLVVGGEALTLQHLSYFKKLNLNWTVINEYGPTETVVGSTTFFFSLNAQVPSKIPIGKPIYNTSIYIVDKQGNIVPEGQMGEIVIGGRGVAKGYCNKPKLTKEKFVEDFITLENRVYKTGDLGAYQGDGELFYYGRIDDQIKIRGYRIELADIEAGLRKVPGIIEAAVIVRKSEENINTIESFFVSEACMDINDIRDELSKHLPAYMLPSKYSHIEKMPVTSNGKIDRKALLAIKTASIETDEDLNAIEQELLPLWREVLKIQNIMPTDKFSVLGGHSLLAVMLISKINKAFSVNVPILALYPNGTLRDIAQQIESEISKSKEAV